MKIDTHIYIYTKFSTFSKYFRQKNKRIELNFSFISKTQYLFPVFSFHLDTQLMHRFSHLFSIDSHEKQIQAHTYKQAVRQTDMVLNLNKIN